MPHLSPIQIGKRVRALAAALTIEATILSLTAAPAGATPKTPPAKVQCTWKNKDGTEDKYDVGATMSVNDTKLKCGKDGKFHEVRTEVTTDGPRADDGGGVYAP